MVTLQGAKQEVQRREQDVERAVQVVADAKAAVEETRHRGDVVGPNLVRALDAARAQVKIAMLGETRAREALRVARQAVEHVAAHEQEFDALASVATEIAKRDSALAALGVETRQRIAAEIAEIGALVDEAHRLYAALPVEVVTGLQLLPPASFARRWSGLAPGADLLAVLSQAVAAAGGAR